MSPSALSCLRNVATDAGSAFTCGKQTASQQRGNRSSDSGDNHSDNNNNDDDDGDDTMHAARKPLPPAPFWLAHLLAVFADTAAFLLDVEAQVLEQEHRARGRAKLL